MSAASAASTEPIITAARAGSDEIILSSQHKETHQMVYAIVENQRGVLHRISGMFRAKGFNITSISIGRTASPDLARMTIVPSGDEAALVFLVNQLLNMIDVIEVGVLSPQDSVVRELALVKFETKSTRGKNAILDLSNALGAKAVDTTHDTLVVEFCSTPQRIDSFISEASKSGIVKEVVRTGLTSLKRGL